MPTTETELWGASGGMALTGRRDGRPLLGSGSPASALQTALDRLSGLGIADVPSVQVLGERAALGGLTRNAPWSVGGAFRILPAADGWFGISLPRPADLETVPALVEQEVQDPWSAVASWLSVTSLREATARVRLLGLAASAVPERAEPSRRAGIKTTGGGPSRGSSRPLVLDFSALWAGPLCAHLLGLAGARVIKVEDPRRPDGARRGVPEFYDLLHGGHESVALDFRTQQPALRALVAAADVVIEASRPRALRNLGLTPEQFAAAGGIWISITAAGRTEPLRIGFGDDVAAGAGLVAWHRGSPYPMGDALADPLTGVTAAAAALTQLAHRRGGVLDVSMHDVCADAAAIAPTGPGNVVAAEPIAREPFGKAAPLGRDTAAALAELIRA
jgi:hypothetical protein